MQPSDIDAAIALARGHSWIVIASLIVWGAVRVCKDDRAVKWFPLEIAPLFRTWAALIFGLLAGVVHKLWTHGAWGDAMSGGFAVGVLATYGHEIIIESIRKGRDLGVSKNDAPPPPPPKPPISMKPPNPTIIGQAFALCLVAGALDALVQIGLMLQLTDCQPAAAPVLEQFPPLVVNSAECKRKGLLLIEAGTCAEKRARLEQLVRTDSDCIGLFADASPQIECRDGGLSRAQIDPTYAAAEGGPHGD